MKNLYACFSMWVSGCTTHYYYYLYICNKKRVKNYFKMSFTFLEHASFFGKRKRAMHSYIIKIIWIYKYVGCSDSGNSRHCISYYLNSRGKITPCDSGLLLRIWCNKKLMQWSFLGLLFSTLLDDIENVLHAWNFFGYTGTVWLHHHSVGCFFQRYMCIAT